MQGKKEITPKMLYQVNLDEPFYRMYLQAYIDDGIFLEVKKNKRNLMLV